jgi:hypothetical protein
LGNWSLRLLGLCLLAFGALAGPAESEAKLDPYYILRGQSFGQFKPRIMFAVDTSGSMTWYPSLPNTECGWSECEANNPAKASRVASARKAINSVVGQTRDRAQFSLMTFGHVTPPASSGQVPTECDGAPIGGKFRFQWVDRTNQGSGWNSTFNAWGGVGTWQLCGDKRPYPYLRHDDLGGFFMPDDQAGDPPAAPLYRSVSDLGQFQSAANHTRKVQYFPQFLGSRVNLDCTDNEQQSLVDNSYGDWGTELNAAARSGNICGRDFYYWPYVDGYPGYSGYYNLSPHVAQKTECGATDYCRVWNDNWYISGVHRRTATQQATLLAPFFSQDAIDAFSVPVGQKGPADRDEAADLVEGLTAPMNQGGIDANYGTPWASAVGDVATYVSGGAPTANMVMSNGAFRHANIASYMSFMTKGLQQDQCVPTALVVISDGQPSPSSEGGTTLHSRLRKFRADLDVKTYVVGFAEGFQGNVGAMASLQNMACAAAGGTNTSSPCTGGDGGYAWDTCFNPGNNVNECAWEAGDPQSLADALVTIIGDVIETPIPAGPGAAVNEFVPIDPNDVAQGKKPISTMVRGYTETPSWKGHVLRGACDETVDPNDPNSGLADFCLDASDPIDPLPEAENFSNGGETGCDFSRTWDAGVCLQNRTWSSRKIYANDENNVVYRISKNDGTARPKFVNQLDAMGLLTPGQEQAEADEIAAFLLGRDAPDGWKLGGLATSTPMIIRRVPKPLDGFSPRVGIRDPHCAGRMLDGSKDVPDSLFNFASDAWEEDGPMWADPTGAYDEHYEYAEAVVVGTDMGLLHAFHFDSGNELFAFLPQNLLPHVAELTANGPINYGQPDELDQHKFGIAATLNQGWVYDDVEQKWRHLAVFGFGKGSQEFVALDLSHMGQLQNGKPVEVLWTTWTVGEPWLSYYEALLGETWSRPALSYGVPGGPGREFYQEPKGYLVFASGYPDGKNYWQGHSAFAVDALTGETDGELAVFRPPFNQARVYDPIPDFATVTDPAVATHCESGYWGEMQEVYIADPYGRLYRWDFGFNTNVDFPPAHTADSQTDWAANGLIGEPLHRFRACQGLGTTCTVAGANKGDVFTFSPSVVSTNRIDESPASAQVPLDKKDRDYMLVALNSGSPYDDAIDGGDSKNDFHSSLYLMVDNHQNDDLADPNDDPEKGLNIPGIGGVVAPGDHATFMREPLSTIDRVRYILYPDGTDETSAPTPFAKTARPLKAPTTRVTGLTDGNGSLIAEIYYITYLVYEPGVQSCDQKWYDPVAKEWGFDFGSTYEITYRLGRALGDDLDFVNGTDLLNGVDIGDGWGAGTGGLTRDPNGPEQVRDGECADGNCAPQLTTPPNRPCDPNEYGQPTYPATTVPVGWAELDGFTPLEIALP